MTRKLKIAAVFLVLILITVGVLWYPYKTRGVPAWRVQIVDVSGNPVIHAQVVEEWIDPVDDGIVSSDSRDTDASGFVLFPGRTLRNRLVLGTAGDKPSARVFTCWGDEYGDADWDGLSSQPPTQFRLRKGACPYG